MDEWTLKDLIEALERSVKLQSHYAKLLNMYDGGHRMEFASAESWLKRLRDLERAPANGRHSTD